jgi:hypothetical protein
VGTRAQVATSACFVVSGLFMCGLGGVLAVAELAPAQDNNGSAQITEVEGNAVHDSIRLVSGEGDADGADNESKTDSHHSDGAKPKAKHAKTGDNDGARDKGRAGQDRQGEPEPGQAVAGDDDDGGMAETSGTTDPVTQSAETASSAVQSPPIAEPPVPCEVREGCQTSITPTTTTTRNGWPAPGGGGGSGGTGGGALPSSGPKPPPMQLPSQAPTIISAAPGARVATGEGPTAPITLPVIVAPAGVPALVPGLGAGGGGPAVPANPALRAAPRAVTAERPAAPRAVTAEPPAAPRAVTAEPPAGRLPLPANIGTNPFVPAPNFRIGYTEYLRSAGISQVAALAVPGIVGMLVFTAAGGLIGYRQAKAGHAVRTGVAARFVK